MFLVVVLISQIEGDTDFREEIQISQIIREEVQISQIIGDVVAVINRTSIDIWGHRRYEPIRPYLVSGGT